jgi:hypothetical protein
MTMHEMAIRTLRAICSYRAVKVSDRFRNEVRREVDARSLSKRRTASRNELGQRLANARLERARIVS